MKESSQRGKSRAAATRLGYIRSWSLKVTRVTRAPVEYGSEKLNYVVY